MEADLSKEDLESIYVVGLYIREERGIEVDLKVTMKIPEKNGEDPFSKDYKGKRCPYCHGPLLVGCDLFENDEVPVVCNDCYNGFNEKMMYLKRKKPSKLKTMEKKYTRQFSGIFNSFLT